jgi:hypothetical protein
MPNPHARAERVRVETKGQQRPEEESILLEAVASPPAVQNLLVHSLGVEVYS